jgi:signal transduction histidine kinase
MPEPKATRTGDASAIGAQRPDPAAPHADLEREAAPGRILGRVLHDFAGPLTAILGYAQLLLCVAVDEETRLMAQGIETEARRLIEMTQTLPCVERGEPRAAA